MCCCRRCRRLGGDLLLSLVLSPRWWAVAAAVAGNVLLLPMPCPLALADDVPLVLRMPASAASLMCRGVELCWVVSCCRFTLLGCPIDILWFAPDAGVPFASDVSPSLVMSLPLMLVVCAADVADESPLSILIWVDV